MDCCAPPPISGTTCPRCQHKGRKVSLVTLNALVEGRTFTDEGWRCCPSPDCQVVYHHDEGGVVEVAELSVRVGHKETAADRPVCYCFGYSAADIASKPTAIPTDIRERCRRGEDRCELTNPKGSCCLGEVLALAKQGTGS